MQKLKTSLISIILLFCLTSFVKAESITGKAEGAEGLRISLSFYADMLTLTEQLSAIDEVDAQGNFSLSYDIENISLGIIKIDNLKTYIYLEPGKNYHITLEHKDYNKLSKQNTHLINENINYTIYEQDSLELNALIDQFYFGFAKFISENYQKLYITKNATILKNFKSQTDKKFENIDIPYFQNLITYKVASLEDLVRIKSTRKIIYDYFSTKEVLFNNPEYMSLFNQYLSKYLIMNSQGFEMEALNKSIEDESDLQKITEVIAQDTLLHNPLFLELVLIKNLMEMYHMEAYSEQKIIDILWQVNKESKHKESAIAAKNAILNLKKLEEGSPAPTFYLPDVDNKAVSLEDFKGKITFLSFYTSYCKECLSEMIIMNELFGKYKNDVNFVSISVDYDRLLETYFIENHNFPWTFLFYNDNKELLQNYNVLSFPTFILIDENGYIINAPAAKPSGEFEKNLSEIFEDRKNKN